MTFRVKFSEQGGSFRARFGEVQNISDGGYERGYAAGYEAGLDYKPPTIYEKDVNFYDYDGALLHSFTKEEFLSLIELPKLPTQNGLICQEWNWSLEGAKNYVGKYGKCRIGATYITDDGATRIYITLSTEAQLEFSIACNVSYGGSLIVDWGDESPTETNQATGNQEFTHTYAKLGSYVVSLFPDDRTSLVLSWDSSSSNILGALTKNEYGYRRSVVKKLEIGKSVQRFGSYSLQGFPSVTSVTFPNTVTSFGHFSLATSSPAIVLPKSTETIATYIFNGAFGLHCLVYPEGLSTIPNNSTGGLSSLDKMYIPEGATEIGNSAFSGCLAIADVIIPDGVLKIGSSAFQGCRSLSVIKFPSSVTTIKSAAFSNCYSMKVYDFTKHIFVPTLESADAFAAMHADCKIRVPATLYDEWVSATNWSNYASQIKPISELNG